MSAGLIIIYWRAQSMLHAKSKSGGALYEAELQYHTFPLSKCAF